MKRSVVKASLTSTIAVAALLAAGSASAATVIASYAGSTPSRVLGITGTVPSPNPVAASGGGGLFVFNRPAGLAGGTAPETLLPASGGNMGSGKAATSVGQFIGICLEFNESLLGSQQFEYQLVSLDKGPIDANNTLPNGMGTTKAAHMAQLLGGVYPVFGGQINTSPGSAAANWLSPTNVLALALQISLWEIVHETAGPYSVSLGNAAWSSSNTTQANAIAQANTWLGYLNSCIAGSACTWKALTNLRAITETKEQNLVKPRQSFVVQVQVVPIPAAAWLLGSGLLGLFAVGRRRKAGA
jgi:hypothetical protein